MDTKQGMMLTTLSFAFLGCAEQRGHARTFVLAPQPPLTTLPNADAFPELEAEVDRAGTDLAQTLGYGDYEVSAVLPQTSAWRYVRDPKLRVVVRRESSIGLALRGRSAQKRCLYLEPTLVQDRLGGENWGPLRIGPATYQARRLDCEVLGGPLASR